MVYNKKTKKKIRAFTGFLPRFTFGQGRALADTRKFGNPQKSALARSPFVSVEKTGAASAAPPYTETRALAACRRLRESTSPERMDLANGGIE